MKTSIIATLGALALAAPAALADTIVVIDDDDRDEPGMYSYAWNEPYLESGIGVGVTLGGGISGFLDDSMHDIASDIGGLWGLRLAIGTHTPIGLELGYTGTAAELETRFGDDNGTLIGTAVEGVARWNMLPHHTVNPFIFGGVGWQHYDVVDEEFSTAATGLQDSDDFLMFPVGAGISFRDPSGFIVDVRGTFRAAQDPDLLREIDGDNAEMHTWEASASVGFEY
jgi:hypothetical protein